MKKVYVIIIIVLILIGSGIFVFLHTNKINTANAMRNPNSIEEILEYGEKLETMDILPNTIVAKLNGEPILFREVGTTRKSIDYNKDDTTERNAFYELLIQKLYIEYAKKYPNEVEYNLNIEQNMEKTKNELTEGYSGKSPAECRKEMLEILCIEEDEVWFSDDDFITYVQSISIEQMLTAKGISIISKFMLEKPELANDKNLESKVSEYKKFKEEQVKLKDINTTEALMTSMKNSSALLTEIRELYIKDLLINSEIELCVDKGELYKEVPKIYQEESKNETQNTIDNNIANETVNKIENYNQNSNNSINNENIDFEKVYNEAINNLDKNYFLTDFENYFPQSLEIKISEIEAKNIAEKGFVESAKRIAAEGVENKESETIKIEAKLPNNYFTRYYYEGDKVYKTSVRNCYVVTRENEMGCGVSIYVDATTGLIIGGEAFGD